jgi:glutamate 5-kinase
VVKKNKMPKKRILLKIGSNTLTKETNHISRGKIEDIGMQIAALKDDYEFVIVSSGAIAAAKQFVKLEAPDNEIFVKQALASIGQPHLMRIFHENFSDLGLHTSQCLLSYSDFEKTETKVNIVNTIDVLVKNSYIPIINENDTVSTDEIKFGDNDKLAALTAVLLDVDILIIATNTNGIYTKASIHDTHPETIRLVTDLQTLEKEIGDAKSSHGTGGMQSKIDSAAIAKAANIETWIVNGLEDNFILKALQNEISFTKII